MTIPPSRKRFQIHLSTAIVLMFVAGGLIWINTIRRPGSTHKWGEKTIGSMKVMDIPKADFLLRAQGEVYFTIMDEYLGWPYPAYFDGQIMWYNTDDELLMLPERHQQFVINGGIKDAVIAVLILSVAAISSEWLMRRRRLVNR